MWSLEAGGNAMSDVRILEPGDEPLVESFLSRHAASSMFPRANLRAVGLRYGGAPLEAVWAAAFEDGAAIGVAAHCWNDNLLVQAPRALAEVVRAATAASGRPLRGFLGPWQQTVAARAALGLAGADTDIDEQEGLYELELDRLEVPTSLRDERVACEVATARERDVLVRWRVDYHVEALGRVADDAVRAEAAREIDEQLDRGDLYVLRDGARTVACSAFNGRLPDCVQVGGVWTPEEHRGRGYARCVVAGSLLDARNAGAVRSVLFTADDNAPARRAYDALGYRRVGEYGLVLLSRPRHPAERTAFA
jgi:RimJ/RimL family protein N-acetyltransferase